MKFRILPCLALLLLLFGCAKNDPSGGPLAGGASDTETAFIQGTLTGAGNTKKAGLMVYLYTTNYIPIPDWEMVDSIRGFCDSTITDSHGFFRFDTVVNGQYNLMAMDTMTNEGVYIDSIRKKEDAAIDFGQLAMLRRGMISGEASSSSWVFIKGTGLYISKPEDSSDFSFNRIPPGNYNLTIVWNPIGGPTKPVIINLPNISIFQDSTTIISDSMFFNH